MGAGGQRAWSGFRAISFECFLRPNSPLSAVDTDLANASSSKTVAIKLQPSKEMTRDAVDSPFNWNISRSAESGPGMLYNFGMTVPAFYFSACSFWMTDSLNASSSALKRGMSSAATS